MLAGHFAIGLAIKARKPEVPALPIMLGVGLLDILFGLFGLVGIEYATPDLDRGPYLYFDLTFIDWDHSLLMAVVWSLAWGAVFFRRPGVAVVAAAAVFSHFLADWSLHDPDMALYPGSQFHFGTGLWTSLGTWAWVLEGVFAAALAAYFWLANSRRGVDSRWPCLLLLVVFLNATPWFSPLKLAAQLEGPVAGKVLGVLALLTFLFGGLLFAWLIDRAERSAR